MLSPLGLSPALTQCCWVHREGEGQGSHLGSQGNARVRAAQSEGPLQRQSLPPGAFVLMRQTAYLKVAGS